MFLNCHFEFQNKMATFRQDQCVQRLGNQSHLSSLSSGLNQLRQQASFCDVSIIVGDQRFSAHKAVLFSTSDYFQGMFSSRFQESTMSEVTVPGTEESFAQILDFAYTGHFTLSLQTVTDILKMTCYMVFTEAMELCADYLKKFKENFTIEDCFEIWSIASNHSSLSDMVRLYRSHLLQNFQKFVKSRSFLKNCSASVMMDFLSDEEIETDTMTEEHILQAALIWLKFDWGQRKGHTVDILKKIRLGLVPLDRLREVLGNELLAIPECKDLVEEVVKLNDTRNIALPPLISTHPELFASRNTITARLKEDMDIDYDTSSSAPIVSLKCETKTACHKITKLKDIPNTCRYPYSELEEKYASVKPVVSNRNQLYAVVDVEYDGEDAEDIENHDKWLSEHNFYQYMSEKNEWVMLPPLPKRVATLVHCEAFQIEEYLYVIAEVGDDSTYSVIQRFSILNKSWEILMDDISFAMHNATLLSTGQILIKGVQRRAGPVNRDGRHYGISVNVVALYKPATNELLDISVDKTVGGVFTFFKEHDNNCYMITRRPGHREMNRVICNFDSDEPTMVVADVVEDKALDNAERRIYPEYTFDKRKLGLVQVLCRCRYHQESEQK